MPKQNRKVSRDFRKNGDDQSLNLAKSVDSDVTMPFTLSSSMCFRKIISKSCCSARKLRKLTGVKCPEFPELFRGNNSTFRMHGEKAHLKFISRKEIDACVPIESQSLDRDLNLFVIRSMRNNSLPKDIDSAIPKDLDDTPLQPQELNTPLL